MVACKETSTTSEEAGSTSDSTTSYSPVNTLADYQLFISTLDSLNVETATIAAKKYGELFKKESIEIRDRGFILFNKYYECLDRNINELHDKDTTDFDPLIAVDSLGRSIAVSQKLKDYNERLKRNGFEVSSTEGMTYVRHERDFITKWFYNFVSPTMKAYLQQLNKENKEGFQEDAGLTIGAEQYVNRLVWWDKFIQDTPGFILIKEAGEHRKELLTFFLIGMDNSSVIDYETNKLSDYFRDAYTYLQKNFPGSQTNKFTYPYFRALSQNDTAQASSILKDYRNRGVIIDFDF